MAQGDKAIHTMRIAFESAATPGLISVVVPCGPDFRLLELAVKAIRDGDNDGLDYEIIVANDGGHDGISRLCAQYETREVILNPNQGPSPARNAALAVARGEFIAFTDSDCIPDRGWLKNARAAIARADYVAGDVQIDPAQVKTFAHYHELQCAFDIESYLRDQHFGATANLMVRRTVLETVGGLDPELRFAEDRELGARIHQAGFRQTFCADMLVLHPPRDYAEKIQKLRREIHAHVDLYWLHPDRFPLFRPTWGKIKMYGLPPRGLNTRRGLWERGVLSGVRLYLFHWFLNIRRCIEITPYILLRRRPGLPRSAYGRSHGF